MSPDEAFVVSLVRALNKVGLEAIIVGNAGAALLGAPVTTQDVDLLIRDTPNNQTKLERLTSELGLSRPVAISELTRAVRILGGAWEIDILFDSISGGLSFASLKSRSRTVTIDDVTATVASLEDIIRSKEAAGRPKDVAVLPILRDTLRVMRAMEESGGDPPT
jgi:predicted nucleotidyltransferase